jgi:hypothetical protein
VDNVLWNSMFASDTQITSGAPGVSVSYAPAGNTVSLAQLGALDTVNPNAVNAATVGVSALPNEVDLQWQGVTDDPNGTGVWLYHIFRQDANNPMQWLASSYTPSFSDPTVVPGTTYTYLLQPVDFHWNGANTIVTVVTPPIYSIDTRRTGVRPTGSY